MYFLFSECQDNNSSLSSIMSLYCPLHTLTTHTVTFSISSSLYCPLPDPHNTHSNIQYQFLSLYKLQQLAMPSRLTVVLVSLLLATPAVIFWSSSYQNITAGVANSSCVLSLYTVPTVQSQTAINQRSFPVHFSGLSSKLFVHAYTTLAFARPTIVKHTGRRSLLLISHKKISRSNLWHESWKQTLLV